MTLHFSPLNTAISHYLFTRHSFLTEDIQNYPFRKKLRLIIHSLVLLLFNTLAHTHTHTHQTKQAAKNAGRFFFCYCYCCFILRSSFPHVLPFWSYSQHQWLLSTIFNTHSFTHTHTLTYINIYVFINLHTCILICFFLLIVHLLHFVHLFAMNFIQ